MKEIYELKQQGKTFKEISEMIIPKVSVPYLAKELKIYCQKNGLEYTKNKPGRRKVDIEFKLK